jgi:uncharacterized protein YhfF
MSLYQKVYEKYGQKPKQIRFNIDEMVRAVLEGRKTQTRGLIDVDISNNFDCDPDGTAIAYMNPETGDIYNPLEIAPYQLGDILYVRETWNRNPFKTGTSYAYRASKETWFFRDMKWKSSSCMPKEVARIFLKVTDVRVERVQDITEEDAKAEGVNGIVDIFFKSIRNGHILFFSDMWNKLYEKKGYSWDTNPWIWIREFERIEVNADS